MLRAYVERDPSNGSEAAGFAAAAIERLGGTSTGVISGDEDHEYVAAMLDIAIRIRRHWKQKCGATPRHHGAESVDCARTGACRSCKMQHGQTRAS